MQKLLTIFLTLGMIFLCFGDVSAQHPGPKINPDDKTLPQWVQMMYADKANIYEVEAAFKAYYKDHIFKKDSYTQYYKRWKKYVRTYTDDKGDVHYPDNQTYQKEEQLRKDFRERFKGQKPKSRAAWEFAGPNEHYTGKYDAADPQETVSEQANIYTIDQSLSNPNVLYAGAEEAGVYKSTDKGATWTLVTHDLYVGGIGAIGISPNDENKAMFASRGKVYRTTDGGTTWSVTGNSAFQNTNITAHEILYHPTVNNLVFIATEQGFYRSTDNGSNWTMILGQYAKSVAIHPTDDNIIYTLQYSPQDKIAYFYKSTDKGLTFTIKPNGWFTVPTADIGKITSYGGDIALTAANPDKVYVLLVGESDASANLQLRGTIGVYMSNDAGENFTHPHGQIGMPYDVNTHPNLMDFDGETSNYNQIYYNTTLICSQLDENKLLLGGLNMWRSDDGGISYQAVGGYIGGLPLLHPDMQELRVFKTSSTTEEVWLGCDGGINYSTDFFQSHTAKNYGILAGGFWGFGQGWSEDVMVGGRYHNGNGGFYDTYPDKKFLSLGGGEAPTGYTSYNSERKVYASDISGKKLPTDITGVLENFTHTAQPNESYWENESSTLTFDWNYWNLCYMGKKNVLYKSINAGASFSPLYTFGTNVNEPVLWIEQAHSNPQVMYVQKVTAGKSQIWRTSDAGQTWAVIPQPKNERNIVFTVSYTNADELWVAYQYAPNGQKVYHSTDAGQNWTNMTTSSLDDVRITGIVHQAKTDGGVYIMVKEAAVLYRNNTLTDWQLHGTNLPIALDGLKMIPFYKENKLRLAAWNMSIWEIELYEGSALQADFSANYYDTYCPQDTVYFTDHSVASSTATYQWTFQGANIATSTAKYPKVTYSAAGQYNVTLKVTDNAQTSTVTKNLFITPGGNYSVFGTNILIQEGFETGVFDPKWRADTEGWEITSDAGGFGNSTKSMMFNNYDIDLGGGAAEIWTAKYLYSTVGGFYLVWDVAYVPYASNYQDSLEVLYSIDCGQTFTSLYLNGGSTMATGPANGSTAFIPTATQWRTDSVYQFLWTASSEIIFVFRNIGHWGQRLYIDNIRMFAYMSEGIEDNFQQKVKLYPNPNNGNFSLELIELEGNTTITVTDILGKVVNQQQIDASRQSFVEYELNGISKGTYLVKVENAKGSLVKKVVIE